MTVPDQPKSAGRLMKRRILAYMVFILAVSTTLRASYQPGASTVPVTHAAHEHPRILFSVDDIPALRARAETTHREIWLPIQEYADSLLDSAPPSSSPRDDDLDAYRNAGDQLIVLAFACVITGEDRYCDRAIEYLITYTSWTQWDVNGERDLGHAHLLFGSSIAFDWLYNWLTADDRRLVLGNLSTRAQQMYEASFGPDGRDEWNNWWRLSYVQNHFIINNSALGIAGLALTGEGSAAECTITANGDVNMRAGPGMNFAVEDTLAYGASIAVENQFYADGYVWWQVAGGLWVRSDVVSAVGNCAEVSMADRASTWIDLAQSRLLLTRDLFEGIDDGSWHEGVLYQEYALRMLLPFVSIMRDSRGIDIYPNTYLYNYIYWRLYNYLPGSAQFLMAYANFEWSWGNLGLPGLLRFVAREYSNPYAEWLAQQLIATNGRVATIWETPWYVFEFLYYDPAISPQPPSDLPLSRVFHDLEGVIWRTGWDEQALIFGLKTGAYGGRFAFDTFVEESYPWDVPCRVTNCQLNIGHDHDDTGTFYLYRAGEWLAPETVGVSNYATSYHNTILIDEQGQYRPIYDNVWRDPADFIGTDGYLETTASSSGFDYVGSDATNRYSAIAGIEDITRHVLFVRPSYFVMVDALSANAPHLYEWVSHFGEDLAVEGNWIKGYAGSDQILGVGVIAPQPFESSSGDDGQPFIRIYPEGQINDVRFITALYPTTEDGWSSRPAFTLLEDNGDAVALRVTLNDGSERIDDILLTYAEPVLPQMLGFYAYDALVAVISTSTTGELERIFLFGGDSLATTGSQTGEPDTGAAPALLPAGKVLVANLNSREPFEAIYTGTSVAVYGDIHTAVTLYAPHAESLTVNGEPQPFRRTEDHIVFGGDEE